MSREIDVSIYPLLGIGVEDEIISIGEVKDGDVDDIPFWVLVIGHSRDMECDMIIDK
jgi:hypothetical protein